jgi:hypothetical protein
MKNGFTSKTLNSMSDKQIIILSSRILSEQSVKGSVVMKKGTNPIDIKKITDTGTNVELREKECIECNQTEMKEEKPSTGLTKKEKSNVAKQVKKGKDIGSAGSVGATGAQGAIGSTGVAKKAEKEYGSKEKGQKVAAASMWKNINKKSVNEWVENVVNKNYHPMATKGEITSLIKQKLMESSTFEKMSLPEDTNECVFADGVSMEQSIAQKVANDNALNKFMARFPNKPYIKNVETAHRTEDGDFRYIVGIKVKSEVPDDVEDKKE